MITIKNLRNEKPTKEWQVKVDRSSVFGNRFYMSNEKERDKVCDMYKQWFDEHIEQLDFELTRLDMLHKKYGKLELFCWCAPRRCHAETIKNYLDKNYLERNTK